MEITCISDLHGHYPKLEGGDLLIVAGDLTHQDLPTEYDVFSNWIKNQPYMKRIISRARLSFIPGKKNGEDSGSENEV